MLLSSLTTNLLAAREKFQTIIEDMQRNQARVDAQLQEVQSRETLMESHLEQLRQILQDVQPHPQELLIFSSAVDDELNSFGFGGSQDKPDENELIELKAKIKQITSDRDHLLMKLGEAKQQAHDDAKRQIGSLEARVTELDNRNLELEKHYDRVNHLWLQADEKRVKLQAELDELKESKAKESEEQALPEPSIKLSYCRRIEKMASELFGHEITTKAALKEAIANHPDAMSMKEDGSLKLEGRAFYKAAEAQIQQLIQVQEPTPSEELNATLNPVRELLGIAKQPVLEDFEAAAETEEDVPDSTQPSYSQQIQAIAEEFFGFEIKSKAALKKAIRNHPGTTFMQALSLETDGRAFYEAAEAQINRLKGTDEPTKTEHEGEDAPENQAETGKEAGTEPVTPADIQGFIATLGELLTLPFDCLKDLAERKGVDPTGSMSELVVRLNGRVSVMEFQEMAAIAKDTPVEPSTAALEDTREAQVEIALQLSSEAEVEEEKEPQMQSTLASASELMGLKVGQLRAFARKHALASTGTKEQLAERLEKYVTVRELYQGAA